MKSIVLINASPKINEESLSKFIAEWAGRYIAEKDAIKNFIHLRESFTKHKTQEDFESLLKADVIIIVFPLYIFCMPGILTRFLQDYYQYFLEHGKPSNNQKIYTVVNCGFPEPEINLEAVRVIRSFSRYINASFRFGILIGSGSMLFHAENAPFMKKTLSKMDNAFSTIAKDIQNNNFKKLENINIAMNFPRWLYMFMGDVGWVSMARKNGLKKKDLYRKPYL